MPKVREEHALREGKIYRKDNSPDYSPGSANNCRCYQEEVPDYICIKDKNLNKAFELYLRRGIKHPILFI